MNLGAEERAIRRRPVSAFLKLVDAAFGPLSIMLLILLAFLLFGPEPAFMPVWPVAAVILVLGMLGVLINGWNRARDLKSLRHQYLLAQAAAKDLAACVEAAEAKDRP